MIASRLLKCGVVLPSISFFYTARFFLFTKVNWQISIVHTWHDEFAIIITFSPHAFESCKHVPILVDTLWIGLQQTWFYKSTLLWLWVASLILVKNLTQFFHVSVTGWKEITAVHVFDRFFWLLIMILQHLLCKTLGNFFFMFM